MLNHIVIMGRIVRDLELKHTPNGTAFTSFALAVDRDYKPNGQKETDFIDVVAWRGTAEYVCKYFGKGRMIAVDGRLQIREWTDNNGNKRKNAEVVADNVYFADSKQNESNYTHQVWPDKPFDSVGEQPVQFDEIEGDGRLPF